MAYTVTASPEFTEWFASLSAGERESFTVAILLLQEKGPTLARPYADTLKGSAYPNMKELRVAHKNDTALRAAFAFDPKRAAILLIGGDKHGKRGFYGKLLRRADELYAQHLRSLKR